MSATKVLSEETVNALIQKDISYMRDDINEIKMGVKALDGVYATQVQVKELAEQVRSLAESIKAMSDKQNGLQRFVPALISSVLTGVLVFLIIAYLTNSR